MSMPDESVVVITGASSGIGRALALELANQGARLHLIARGRERLEAVATECKPTPVELHATDLTDDRAVASMAERILGHSGRIDALVHSMGIFGAGNIEPTSVSILDEHYRANVRTPYVTTQAFLPALRACQGQLVFLNSTVIQAPRAGLSAYAASKNALRSLADTLREEVNGDGVRVLSVYPGRTATPMQETVARATGTTYRPERLLQATDVAKSIVSALELPRTAELTDLFIRPMLKG